jgi:endonuclease/exonuclease/phosphatase (EEP) superfamily protein YafD
VRINRIRLNSLLQAAAVITVFFSLVTFLPIDHFALQLFTHFRLQYLVIALLLLVYFAFNRQGWYVLVLAIVTAANTWTVAPWYTGYTAKPGDQTLDVLLANVLSTNTQYQRLFDLLETEDPDLVVLLEVSPHWLQALVELRNDYPWSYAEAREGNFGIAVFSRMPLVSASHVDSPPLGFPTIIASVDVGGELLQLVSTHPMIPVTAATYEARNQHLEHIASLLGERRGRKLLVGDLNMTMWDTNYSPFAARTGLINARQGYGVLASWPTWLPFAMIPIDHIMMSDDIGVEDIRRAGHIGSDHLPLIVRLSL